MFANTGLSLSDRGGCSGSGRCPARTFPKRFHCIDCYEAAKKRDLMRKGTCLWSSFLRLHCGHSGIVLFALRVVLSARELFGTRAFFSSRDIKMLLEKTQRHSATILRFTIPRQFYLILPRFFRNSGYPDFILILYGFLKESG